MCTGRNEPFGTASVRRGVSLWTVAILSATLVVVSGTAGGAEFRLRAQCHVRGTPVTLGDVAQVFAADQREADRLASMELFPPPAASRKRFLSVGELQDLLDTRGIDRFDHQFSGAAQVAIVGGRSMPAREERPVPVSFVRRAERRAGEAVKQFLQGQIGADQHWIVEATLDEDQARLLLDTRAEIAITRLLSTTALTADLSSWTGSQRFELSVATAKGTTQFPLEARVSLPPVVVVAARILPRGTLIRPGDVELKHQTPGARPSDEFHSIDEVIGMEAIQPIGEGKTLLRGRSVRPPLLVKRGDAVTVIARAAGVRIRTTGRARESGSLGETIQVESMQNRETFFARVSKWREVDIYVQPSVVEATRSAPHVLGQRPGYSHTKGIERASFIR